MSFKPSLTEWSFLRCFTLVVCLCIWQFPHGFVSAPQPVHNNGSSGYGSLGSNGSHEHYISVASSSDSNGNLWEDSHREPVRHHSDQGSNGKAFGVAKINRTVTLCVYSRRWLCSRSMLMWTEWRVGVSRLISIPATKCLFLANLPQVIQSHSYQYTLYFKI